jgi:hypothetical protein
LGPRNYRLYCLSSDGDARRRRALISITLDRRLPATSPIYPLLAPLPLFDLTCGEDDITPDFDYKHVLKRFRNTLLRQKGVIIDGVSLSTSIIKAHLVENGMAPDSADTLLAPNDKQDVVLMLKLLHSISLLKPSAESDKPTSKSTRRVLRLLGKLYGHLLHAYTNVTLSLSEQLVHLSAASHLVLAIYNQEKGEFIPVQTCFDTASMIKNVYFCVAKVQKDNPEGSFWLVLVGSDGLEKVFGKVRTIVGNDTNADQYQLTNRIDGAVQCVNILEEHPEWGGQARRLTTKALPHDIDDVSSKYDHISPKSWKGDVRVKNVVLSGCWMEGRRIAEEELCEADIVPPFANMELAGGYTTMCPFGHSNMMLVDGISPDECEETEEERDDFRNVEDVAATLQNETSTIEPIVGTSTPPESSPTTDPDLDPDFDDLAAAAEVSASLANTQKANSAWVSVEGKKVHKATIMRLYSNPFAVSDSKDRLKRVRGYSQYHEDPSRLESSAFANHAEATAHEADDTVLVQDPALVLVRCNKKTFLSVFQILGIRFNNISVQELPTRYLHEPNVRLSGQIMRLALVTTNPTDAADKPDWEWNGAFEPRSAFQNIEGRWVEVINPVIRRAATGSMNGKDTYAFRTADLRDMAALLYEHVGNDIQRLPQIAQTASFPYRSELGRFFFLHNVGQTLTGYIGYACFACEKDAAGGDVTREASLDNCRLCQRISLSALKGPALVAHMSAHILHDPRMRGADNPCGFCLNTETLCSILLSVSSKATTIDMKNSRCPHLRKLNLTAASKFSPPRSPCTNHPLACPLCPPKSPAVWKYNLRAHIIQRHPTSQVELYKDYYSLHDDETTLMKAVFQVKPRQGGPTNKVPTLITSDVHSTRLALRQVLFVSHS